MRYPTRRETPRSVSACGQINSTGRTPPVSGEPSQTPVEQADGARGGAGGEW
jgi:hypothetical protein